MKKLLLTVTAIAMLTCLTSCASKKAAEPVAAEPVVERVIPDGPVTLELGTDYTLEPVFGTDLFTIDGTTIYYADGATNSNHALMLKLTDPGILYDDSVIEITYEMGDYNPAESCQLVIQPASDNGADYSSQSYPILYNNFEEGGNSFQIDVNKLKTSSVKKKLAGVRLINNQGGYQQFTWQGNWSFTITSVVLKKAE
ncbi:MAG: hypothetical protein MJ188_08320 [Treponema sp.]|nr:hypothetical protein [Treponema sp.]